MIFIDAIEIDERLASHLVGPDPFLSDQLIGFRFSVFSIAAAPVSRRRLLSSLSAMVHRGPSTISAVVGPGPSRVSSSRLYASHLPLHGRPWSNLAFFHNGYKYSSGLIRLGRLDEGPEPLLKPGKFPLRIEHLSPRVRDEE
jgi:hypothetical protein